MNHAGEISQLVALAEPDVRVWTNVGDAHLGLLRAHRRRSPTRRRKSSKARRPSTVLVANADDPRVMARTRGVRRARVTFGTSSTARTSAQRAIEELRRRRHARARAHARRRGATCDVPLLGVGNLLNVLAATAVAHVHGVPLDDGRRARRRRCARRGTAARSSGCASGVTLVDDSYNSSPSALMRALEAVGRRSPPRAQGRGARRDARARRVRARRCTSSAGTRPSAAGISRAGRRRRRGRGARSPAAARDAGLATTRAVHVETSGEAADLLLASLAPGDLVLVKGSRGIGTDLVVERVKAEWS